jgi:hypothetical protein
MESLTRSVRDLDTADRHALEHVIGKHLSENQQIVIQVLNTEGRSADNSASGPQPAQAAVLPPWCNVYEGLTDHQIADVEASIIRASDSRTLE